MAGLGVQRPEGLVHEQHLGVDGQGARDGGALLHAAGQLGGIVVFKARQAHHLDEGMGAGLPLGALEGLALEPVEHVLQHGLPGKEREMLEHDAPIRAGSGHGRPIHGDEATLDGQKPAHEIEQRGFSAAGRPQQGDELLIAHAQVHILQRQHRRAALGPVEMPQPLDDYSAHAKTRSLPLPCVQEGDPERSRSCGRAWVKASFLFQQIAFPPHVRSIPPRSSRN